MKHETLAIQEWMQEAKEALERQRNEFWYRGDGRTIMDALDTFLTLMSAEDVAKLYERREWRETHDPS